MFKFDKSKSSDKGETKAKDSTLFESLLRGLKETTTHTPTKKVDLRRAEDRKSHYTSLNQEELIKYTTEADSIIDLMIASVSLLIEDKESPGKSGPSLKSIAKMLFAQAGERVKVLRKTS